MLNWADYNRFCDLFSDYLNTINHLNMKLFIVIGILQVLKFELLLKFRILEIWNFHLWGYDHQASFCFIVSDLDRHVNATVKRV